MPDKKDEPKDIDMVIVKVYYQSMPRYDSLRKLERNKALKEYAIANPKLSYKELGEIFGIDASRAWRIIKGNKRAGR